MKLLPILISLILFLTISTTMVIADVPPAEVASTSEGKTIIGLIANGNSEKAVAQIERERRAPLETAVRQKLVADIDTLVKATSGFRDVKLIQVATVTASLRREIWILTSADYVLRVELIYFMKADKGPRLMHIDYDDDLSKLPWSIEPTK